MYVSILEAAMKAKAQGANLRHIIYSSSSECQRRDHMVPHWETSWHTEQHLKQLSEDQDVNIHFVRYAHCNENLLAFYAPSKSGWMAFPWDVSVSVHTASVQDGARVVCKLFLDPKIMPNGDSIDIVTDFASPEEMAKAVSKVQGRQVQAFKGPWILLNVVSRLVFEPNSIVRMGEYIEQNWSRDFLQDTNKIHELLKDEVEKGEPLESLSSFCERCFTKVV